MVAEDVGNASVSNVASKVIDVVKSENDQRKYKFLILENEIKILLVSDPTSEKSASSVNVHVGHCRDPDAVPGIAHFCEHMLFLGTEKYPVEGDFSQFLSQNGGHSNASTSAEHTNYHFDVKSEALLAALDRFAQFFLTPLFDADSTDRELHAIDSEHQKNILNDSRRMYFIDKSTVKPGHIYEKFGTGNLETLKIIPEQKNIDIRELLLQFHTEYYSSNIITVAVLGRETIEELENITVPLFKNVKNKSVSIATYDYPFGENELGVILKVPTIKEMKKLELKFQIPDLMEHYTSKPSEYVSHLIGHEGEGSLLSLLKKKAWVNSLWAGSHRGLKGFEFFNIGMDLTEEGMNQIYGIIDIIFQYINMLKKEEPQLWVYNEMRMLNEINFRFKDKEQAYRYVLQLSKVMHLFPPEDVLYGPYRLDTFAPNLIVDVLNELTPTKLRVTVASQIFEGKTDRKAKYYDAGYSLERIPKEQIEKWINIGYHPELHMPNKNLFIPSSLDIIVPREEKEVKGVPTLIKDTEIIRVWYKTDDTFFLPKASLKIHISSPYACMTPSNLNHLCMYIRLVRDEMVEFGYDAELAGIKYNIDWSCSGISIQISGFNSNQLVLLRKILVYLTKLEIKKDRFDVNKELLEQALKNVELSEPYMQVEGLRNYVISEKAWSPEERLDYMKDMTIESVKSFIPEVLKDIYIECLFCGNLLINDVKEIYGVIEKIFIEDNHARAMLPIQHLMPREYEISNNPDYLYEKRSKIHSNSCIQIYLQVGLQDTQSNILCELFSQIIHAPFFNMLRTKEQLGYIVFSGLSRSCSVQGLRALIQSDKSPSTVDERIDAFFESFEETLNSMSDEQFKDYIDALAMKKLEKPKRLHHEASKYWIEIIVKQYHFRRSELEVEELRKLKKEDVIQFFKTYIAPSSKERKKIAVVVLGKDAKSLMEGKDDKSSWQPVSDVLQFKANLPLYPHVKPYNDVPLLATTKSKL